MNDSSQVSRKKGAQTKIHEGKRQSEKTKGEHEKEMNNNKNRLSVVLDG